MRWESQVQKGQQSPTGEGNEANREQDLTVQHRSGLHLLENEQPARQGDSLQGRGVFSRLHPAVLSRVGGRRLNRYSWLWAAVRRGQHDERGRKATRQSQPVPHCCSARGIGVLPLENKNTIAIKRSSECDCLFVWQRLTGTRRLSPCQHTHLPPFFFFTIRARGDPPRKAL